MGIEVIRRVCWLSWNTQLPPSLFTGATVSWRHGSHTQCFTSLVFLLFMITKPSKVLWVNSWAGQQGPHLSRLDEDPNTILNQQSMSENGFPYIICLLVLTYQLLWTTLYWNSIWTKHSLTARWCRRQHWPHSITTVSLYTFQGFGMCLYFCRMCHHHQY